MNPFWRAYFSDGLVVQPPTNQPVHLNFWQELKSDEINLQLGSFPWRLFVVELRHEMALLILGFSLKGCQWWIEVTKTSLTYYCIYIHVCIYNIYRRCTRFSRNFGNPPLVPAESPNIISKATRGFIPQHSMVQLWKNMLKQKIKEKNKCFKFQSHINFQSMNIGEAFF